MNIVQLENVSKEYINNRKIIVKALKNVSLNVKKGDFVSILGPSGSGKSTMLHILGGLERPTTGKVVVNNRDLSQLTENELAEYRRKEIGFVFQQFDLIPMLNVRENIELPLLIGKEKIDKSYVDGIIEFLGLKDRVNHYPGELSGGQQQRVCIGRALATNPGIILADEPTGNLDQKTSFDIIEFFKKCCNHYNQTIIMITHDQTLSKCTNNIYEIIDGQIRNREKNF